MGQLMRARDIIGTILPISKTHFHRRVREGSIPPPVVMIGHVKWWNSRDINDFAEGRLARGKDGYWTRPNGEKIIPLEERQAALGKAILEEVA